MIAARSQGPVRDEPFQFALRHLFLLTSGVSAYLALERCTGPLLPTLAVGTFVLAAVIILLRIENMLLGGVWGATLAFVILILVQLAPGASANWGFVTACLFFPVVGYCVGALCAAERILRSG